MNYIFYPDEDVYPEQNKNDLYINGEICSGIVGRKIQNLGKNLKTQFLQASVIGFLNMLHNETAKSLQPYYDNEKLRRLGEGLEEIRIPKTSKKGVFRIYFYKIPNEDTLVFLDAEFKKEKEPNHLEQARKILKQYRDSIRKGKQK